MSISSNSPSPSSPSAAMVPAPAPGTPGGPATGEGPGAAVPDAFAGAAGDSVLQELQQSQQQLASLLGGVGELSPTPLLRLQAELQKSSVLSELQATLTQSLSEQLKNTVDRMV